MREIKFRVFDKIRKIMIDMDDAFFIDLKGLLYFGEYPNNLIPFLDTDKFEIMQYTGLKDKDGEDIYEGDIIQLDDDWGKMTGATRKFCLVGFKEGCFMYGRYIDPYDMNTILWLTCSDKNYCEVVGSVYENPELIENNKNE